ncbi:uncharacterized protein YjaZ [Bacillus mesophilus]|uniref:DUF2268 domain-containing protein n=1 Tax=Bacillus mesophilus TaxID=1808955 RepID=A0A6M0Q4C7_9BACI|nr:DUF2268 domain-containing protein [Bacillus mesophilus]MBM7659767.1 uncharacterized protein YjaZ [Bacillus mesophilus]NEY70629.1 DUF2268 domain-containing protein [Bacillus mesophilus]
MSVVNTKKWLSEHGENPIKLCEKLIKYFNGSSQKEIYDYLCLYGMYKPSIFNKRKEIEQLITSNYWKEVNKHYTSLRLKFKGPDIPIFIFPINQRNSRMMEENKGKSGLAFYDKLFLFLSPNMEEMELKALITHEYHHVCRLDSMNQKDEELTLLDTILLEGMAEHAVKKECGEERNAFWTKLYQTEQLEKWYKEIILPKQNITKKDQLFQELLYGMKGYPRMLGYSVGFYLVEQIIENHKYTLHSLEKLTKKQICKIIQSQT